MEDYYYLDRDGLNLPLLAPVNDGGWWWRYHRRVAAGGDVSDKLDYTVLSVVVMTLGLILCVELVRHRLDVKANGRPFFKTVLEGVYRELATLGIVEFFIFILHKYYEDLNLAVELVFADVHFTLFYTALFNAFQSTILAICSSRVSDRLWVRTEQLELDHYVELREEFERVDALLYREEDRTESSRRRRVKRDATAEDAMEFNITSVRSTFAAMLRFIRYPHLYRRHNDLLIQVRFHELRVHFLQANDLPLKLKVSDYLKRSELHVLIKLVHITTFAWLLLLGAVNLTYFVMGMVVYASEDLSKVGVAMTVLFLSTMILFVIGSLIIYNKMKRIFGQIMRMKLIAQSASGDEVKIGTALTETERDIPSQIELFWWDDPRYVISFIQFMQFGFAIALATLLVFWDDISVDGSHVDGWVFLVVVFTCYLAFVLIMAQVIPRYTLCTSLGQLVNHSRLHETLARFRLEEAQRKRLQKLEEDTMDDSVFLLEDDEDELDDDAFQQSTEKPSAGRQTFMDKLMGIPKPPSKPAKTYSIMSEPVRSKSKTYEDVDLRRHRATASVTATQLAELVTIDTKDLRESLPLQSKMSLDSREELVRERRMRRKKAVSEGVATMRYMGGLSSFGAKAPDESKGKADESPPLEVSQDTSESPSDKRRQRRKARSASASIQLMRDMPSRSSAPLGLSPLPERHASHHDQPTHQISNPKLLAELVMTDTKELRSNLPPEEQANLASREEQHQERRPRRKSLSDHGVGAMRSMSRLPAAAVGALKGSIAEGQDGGAMSGTERRRKKSFSDSTKLERMRQELEEEMKNVREFTHKEEPDSTQWRVRRKRSNSSASASMLDSVADVDDHVDAQRDEKVICSNESDAGLSDVDDVPEYDPSIKLRQQADPEPSPTIRDIAYSYFRSRKYQMVSAVFGTMVCFFFVALRVESLLLATNVLPDLGNTMDPDRDVLFWMETGFLFCFFAASTYVVFLFQPCQGYDHKRSKLFLSGILDIIISGTCLTLLMVAESQRCCNEESKRYLGDAEDGYEKIECCPRFGSRAYGGLGNIEPFTSLIALRILRFYVSKRAVTWMEKRFEWTESRNQGETAQSERLDHHPLHPAFDTKGHIDSHKTKTMEDETGTVIELWKHALGLYPDIVDKYGEFSGELLQAMLGVEVIEVPKNVENEPAADHSQDMAVEAAQPYENNVGVLRGSTEESKILRKHVKDLISEEGFVGLSSEAQAIILSGKTGKSVKSVDHQLEGGTEVMLGSARMSALPILNEAKDLNNSIRLHENASNVRISPRIRAHFEFDGNESFSRLDRDVAVFIAPNSRLLRSMRRADRKLLPLLDQWTVVDVVMTKHELVYFDANDIDDFRNSDRPVEEICRIESIHQAVVATKGGKGLRLRDVAIGRKVVGHVAFSSIDSIHVERVLPAHDFDVTAELEHSDPAKEVQEEFWKPSSTSNSARAVRWKGVKEDRLKIHSHQDTLYLRFYRDLEDSEMHQDRCLQEKEEQGPLFKNNAFQWCQTIVRLCNIDQLKQKLPHYGDDNADELRDYLVCITADEAESGQTVIQKIRLKMHHRRTSTSNLLSLAEAVAAESNHPLRQSTFSDAGDTTTAQRKPSFLRRSSSTGDFATVRDGGDSGGEAPRRKSLFLRRSVSSGERSAEGDTKQGPEFV